MEAGKKEKKKIYTKQLVLRLLVLSLLVLLVLLFLIYFLAGRNDFDPTIIGSPYQSSEMAVPTPSPAPLPEGIVARQPRHPGDLVSVYNDYTYKTAYLTFDDGPSAEITPQILDILKEKGVRATFFVLGRNAERHQALIQRIAAEGHSIANHTYSHEYKQLYNGTKRFVEEVARTEQCIADAGGGDAYIKLFRFPGGSYENRKNPQKWALYEMGYSYIDWNALSGDAERHNVPADEQLSYVQKTTNGVQNAVVLMHDADTKQTTVEALPGIIDYLRAEGYIFKTLKEAVAS